MSQSIDVQAKSIKKLDSSMDVSTEHLQAETVELQKSNHDLPRCLVDNDFSPLSGKPYCHCIVNKTNINRYQMIFLTKLNLDLPSKEVLAVVTCGGKAWEMKFLGNRTRKQFDSASYEIFAIDNDLKVGDAIFWEVMEISDEKINFKVQIIRGDFPSELEAQVNGKTAETPIIIG